MRTQNRTDTAFGLTYGIYFEKALEARPSSVRAEGHFRSDRCERAAARVHSASAGIPETVFCEAGYARLRIAKKMGRTSFPEKSHSSHGDGTHSTERS